MQVTNIGLTHADEVAQLYIRKHTQDVTPRVKELAGFERISLGPGASRTIQFVLSEAELGSWDTEMRFGIHSTKFTLFVGGDSAHPALTHELQI